MTRHETLQDWRDGIEREIDYGDVRPYSHNIINTSLQAIAEKFGQAEANKAIEDFGLEELGWHKVEEAKHLAQENIPKKDLVAWIANFKRQLPKSDWSSFAVLEKLEAWIHWKYD